MESQVTGLPASLGCAMHHPAGLRPARQRKHSLGLLPAQVGWKQGDPVLLSHSVSVGGVAMFLSTPGAWMLSWGVHYPIHSRPRRCSAFPFLLSLSWQPSPSLPAPVRLTVGLRKHGEGGRERGNPGSMKQRTRRTAQLSLLPFPI